MANRVCWSCDTKTHMTMIGPAIPKTIHGDDLALATFTCDNCGVPSVGMIDFYYGRTAGSLNDQLDHSEEVMWLPQRGLGRDFPDVPQHIASAASEAYQCQSIDCLRAAVMLARAVIEATAKDKGITKGRLIDKIDKMHDDRLIREHVKDGAHEVRFLGNDMAHGDFVDAVTEEEADLVLTLMGEVLAEVFQSPARVEQARAAREAKQRASAEPET